MSPSNRFTGNREMSCRSDDRRCSAVTLQPWATSCSIRLSPRKPVPPVTNAVLSAIGVPARNHCDAYPNDPPNVGQWPIILILIDYRSGSI